MKKETTLPDELARLLLLETDEDVKTEDDSPSLDYRRDIRSILTALYERAPYIYALFKAAPKTEFRIALTDEARDRVSEQLHARYVATIVGRLREVGTLDLAAADLPIRVVDRPIDDFRTDPSLDLARYVRDVLVDRATYLDERSFRLDFTESDFNLDDYILHGDAAEDDRPIVRLAGREGSMTVRSDGFRTAPYLALRDCCALSQLVEYAMRIRSGAVDPRSLPLFQLESCLSDRFEQDWNRVAEAVRRRC